MRYAVLMVLCCGLGWGQAQMGSVEGRVTNSGSGEGVRKVSITLHGTSGEYSGTTDGSGHYLIDKVAPGPYSLTAQRQNFSIQNYGAVRPGMGGTQITVAAGGSVTGIDVKLTPFGVISGKVVDEDGDPVTGVQVTVMKWTVGQGARRLQPAGGNGSTNDRGEYRIYNLPSGKYILSAQGRDADTMAMSAMTAARMQHTGVAPGRPAVREIYVPTYYPSVREVAAAATIPLGPGQEAPGMDIQVRKSRVYTIQGRVTGVVKGTRMTIQRYPKESASSAYYGSAAVGVKQEDGTFTFLNTTPGVYMLVARDDRRIVARQEVVVADNDVEGLTLALMEPASVTGRLRFASGTGKVQGTRVWLSTVEGPPMNSPTGLASETGSFEMEDVAQDRYKVNCVAPGGSYLKTVLWNGHASTDGVVEVSGGTANLELVFEATTAQVDGEVKTADDQAAPGVRVLLVPASRRESDLRMVMTDAQGHFTAKSVAPGSYTALAVEGELYGMPDPLLLKALEKDGATVQVDENGHATTSLKVIPESALEAAQ